MTLEPESPEPERGIAADDLERLEDRSRVAREARVPWWARVLAGGLVLGGLGVLIWGRGGTAVLIGVALVFGAYAAVRLSVPDGHS